MCGRLNVETDVMKDVAVTEPEPSDGPVKQQRSTKSHSRRSLRPLVAGWRTYARQSVVFAGISLALLYMTVLGFDSITIGQ